MRLLVTLGILAAMVPAARLAAQDAAESQLPAAKHVASVLAGYGTAMGWLGVQGEAYLVPDRVSAFLGLGYTPAFDGYKAEGLTTATGLRGYTTGRMHRAFAELSYSQLAVHAGSSGDRIYGPGVSLGYLYIARNGLTVHVSAGAGYVGGYPEADDNVVAIGGMGVGYTWRR